MTANRLVWTDALRGVCAVAVVLFHVVLWHYETFVAPSSVASLWHAFNEALGAVRMPVLLAISGYLASRRIKLGWRSPLFFERAGGSYYLYVVWMLVLAVFYALVANPTLPHYFSGATHVLRELVIPTTPLWFILALCLYTVILAALAKVDYRIVIAGLLVLAFVTRIVGSAGFSQAIKIPQNFVFFAVGVYCAAALQERVAQRSLKRTALTTSALAIVVVVSTIDLTKSVFSVLDLVRGLVAVVVAFELAGLAAGVAPRASSAVAVLGRRTLEIYVLHIPLLLGVIAVSDAPAVANLLDEISAHTLAMAVYPIVMTATIVFAAIVIRTIVEKVWLGWLFIPPVPYIRFLGRLHTRVMNVRAMRVQNRPTQTPDID